MRTVSLLFVKRGSVRVKATPLHGGSVYRIWRQDGSYFDVDASSVAA